MHPLKTWTALTFAFFALNCQVSSASAATDHSAIQIATTASAPSLSGSSLDGWDAATVIDDFHPYLPANTGDSKFKTRAYLLWGKDALYLAIQAFDP